MSIETTDLVGTWSLVDWRIEYHDGRVTWPFGNDAVGQLLYGADGHMSATVSRATRPRFDRGNARRASNLDKAAAFDGYFHYAGRWRLDGDVAVHSVSIALNPNFVGTEQRRKVELSDGRNLELSAVESTEDEAARRHVLVWRRSATG